MKPAEPPALPSPVTPPRWRRRLALLAIVLLSLVLRGAYFTELNRGPCIWMHRWPASDMNFFDAWARDIAAGDTLTNRSLHPYHAWHEGIARQVLGADLTPARGRALWDRWYGGKCFHQEPLYVYFIAAIYWLVGPDPRCAFIVQMLIGVANNVLIYLIARRYFGNLAGELAGILAVFCAPLLYYDLILVRSTLSIFAALVLVLILDQAAQRDRGRFWLLAGLTVGVASLLRVTYLLVAIGAAAAIVAQHRRRPAQLARRAGALVGGIALGCAPLVARNIAVGAPPFQLNSVGAVTFAMGNTVDYPPMEGAWVSRVHVPRIMQETDGCFWPTIVATLKTHPSAWSYLSLLGRKFLAIWHWYEPPNNTNFYYFRLRAPVLGVRWASFGLVAPLALVGMALAARRARLIWPLYVMVLAKVASMVIVYVLSRFRAPLLALLIPFAAFAVVQIVDWCHQRRFVRALLALTAAAGLCAYIARPLPDSVPLIRTVDYMVPETVYYGPEAAAAREAGQPQRAAQLLSEAVQWLAPVVQQMGPDHPARDADERELAGWTANLYRRYAAVLRDLNLPQRADELDRHAADLEAAARP